MERITDTIRGDKLGKRANDWYTWVVCHKCGAGRYVLSWKLKLPNFTGLCLLCNGKQNKSRWNNGVMATSAGYIYIQKPEHPEANAHGYVRHSHLVLEQKLGRPLREGCIAHHLNGVVDDDRPKNLMEILNTEHPTLHAAQRKLMRESKKEVVELVEEYFPDHNKWRGLSLHGAWRCKDDCPRCKLEAELKEWGIE